MKAEIKRRDIRDTLAVQSFRDLRVESVVGGRRAENPPELR